MSKANYESYKAAYRKKQNSLTKKGLQMYDSMLTKSEFEAVYEATRNDLKEMVKRGERKVIGNVTQTIVTEQTYYFNKNQGQLLAEYAKDTGQKLTQQQIRTGYMLDMSGISDYYDKIKKNPDLIRSDKARKIMEYGNFSKESITLAAKQEISNVYFGSE